MSSKEEISNKPSEKEVESDKDKNLKIKKKLTILEQRYKMIFKNSKNLEDILTNILKGLFEEFKGEIFEEDNLFKEIGKDEGQDIIKGEYALKYSEKIKEIIKNIIKYVSSLKEKCAKFRNEKKEANKQIKELENKLFEKNENLRKIEEELKIKKNSFEKIENLLNQKETHIKQLEEEINQNELEEHKDLISNLKNINQENSYEENLKKEISEQTNLIIYLRKKIENLKQAKKVIITEKENEEDKIWIDNYTQTDPISFEDVPYNEYSIEDSNDRNIDISVKMMDVMNSKTDITYQKKSVNKDKEDKFANQYKFLRDVLEKYFEYRINGNKKKEEMALKLILDSIQLDFQKKSKIQNFEHSKKKLFKFF